MNPRLKAFLGWGWLALAATAGMGIVIYADPLGDAITGKTALRISPHFTGGEPAAEIDHGPYRTIVQKPVFEALLWDWPFGFAQVRWEPAGALPALVRDEIDPLGDGTRGFYVTLNTATGEASYEGRPPYVSEPPKAERLRDSWVVRVRIKVPDRAKRKGPRETH